MKSEAIVGVLLAAGAGSRFHDSGHKLLAELPASATRPAESVVARALASVTDADLGEVVVVTGRLDAADLHLLHQPGVGSVHNPRWADGQMTSVHVGLGVARDRHASVAVIGLADQPGIDASAWRAVARADAPIAVATYDGRRGNPVALRSDVWDLLPSDGDEGARALMRRRADLVVEVPCTGSPTDIDTAEDLRRWQSN